MSTQTTPSVKTPVVSYSVKEFIALKGYTTVHNAVRSNTNAYPFVTFINAKNEAENVYFSKNSSADYGAGQIIAKGFFDELRIVEAHNAEGELRYKLSKNASTRLTLEDLF